MRILRLLVFLVVLIPGAGYLWSSVRAVPQETPVKKADISAEELARATAVFKGKCARCHGADGRGQTDLGKMLGVPDFTNGKWWKDYGNDEDLIESITNGNGGMPTFRKKLTKPEISLLADYVRHFNKPEQLRKVDSSWAEMPTRPEP